MNQFSDNLRHVNKTSVKNAQGFLFDKEPESRDSRRCPRCGHQATAIHDAPPPHFQGLHCARCHKWIKWLPKPIGGGR